MSDGRVGGGLKVLYFKQASRVGVLALSRRTVDERENL